MKNILLHAPSAWLDAHPLVLRTPGAWVASLGVGLAMHACPRPMLLPPGARAGRGPSMQTPGARSAMPWALGADSRTWLQAQGERACRHARQGLHPALLASRLTRWVQTRPLRFVLTALGFRGLRGWIGRPCKEKNEKSYNNNYHYYYC